MKLILSLIFCSITFQLAAAEPLASPRWLLRAAHVFNGHVLLDDTEMLIVGNRIAAIGKQHSLNSQGAKIIELGDSTLLPGLIDLHTHLDFQKVNKNSVLQHGVTTARDVGGALLPLSGGDGQLRLLTAGAILTAVNGYPIPVFGKNGLAQEIATPEQARVAVREQINGGAAVIKVALDSGEERGAPWTAHPASLPAPWPLLSLDILHAITDEAHKLGKRVTAHLSENKGVALALDAGVDEWAHIPCEPIADALLERAVAQKVNIISTLDVLSHCDGVHHNAHHLAHLGASFLYGAEIAHPDIPWGIDAQELLLMQHLLGLSPTVVLEIATAKAGEYLGLAPLGTLAANAPADIIAVRGNPLKNLKLLEYPDLVLSGGKIVVNHY